MNGKKVVWKMRGTIVGASAIQDFKTRLGKENRSAMLHIREDEHNAYSAQMAVKVSGDMCNYVRCVGAHVMVEYVVRVFEFMKNGIRMLGNDVYATSVRMV